LELPQHLVEGLVPGGVEVVGDVADAPPVPVDLTVRRRLGVRHELMESRDDLGGYRRIAFERARVVNEREKRFQIAPSERGHRIKHTPNGVSTQRERVVRLNRRCLEATGGSRR
jgi:hypothetical protein